VLAITNVTKIAPIFDRGRISELTRPEFLFDVPVRAPVSRRIEESTLQRCHRAVNGTPTRDAVESILGGRAKSGAIRR
jgi:hypothetical protein